MGAIPILDHLKKKGGCFQPPDAENRMSGGVGGVTGIIPSPRPDLSGLAL